MVIGYRFPRRKSGGYGVKVDKILSMGQYRLKIRILVHWYLIAIHSGGEGVCCHRRFGILRANEVFGRGDSRRRRRGGFGAIFGETITFLELGTAGGVTFTMARAEVLSHEGSVTVGKVAAIDLFRGMIESMATQVFGARITLPTAFKCAFELTIGENFATASPSLGGLTVVLHISCHDTMITGRWSQKRMSEHQRKDQWLGSRNESQNEAQVGVQTGCPGEVRRYRWGGVDMTLLVRDSRSVCVVGCVYIALQGI